MNSTGWRSLKALQDDLTCLLPPRAPALRSLKRFELHHMNLEAMPTALLRAMSQLSSLTLGENPSSRLPPALREVPTLKVLSMHVSPSLHLSDLDVKMVAALLSLRVVRFWVDVAAKGFVDGFGSAWVGEGAWREGSREADVCDHIRWQNPLLDVQVQRM